MHLSPTKKAETDNDDTMSAMLKLAEKIDDIFLRQVVESYALLSLSASSW